MTPKAEYAFKIFERDGFRCQYCAQRFSEDQPPLHLHRRVFGSQGGDYSEKNVASCCWKCHADHGALKGRKLYHEKDDTVIKNLERGNI